MNSLAENYADKALAETKTMAATVYFWMTRMLMLVIVLVPRNQIQIINAKKNIDLKLVIRSHAQGTLLITISSGWMLVVLLLFFSMLCY